MNGGRIDGGGDGGSKHARALVPPEAQAPAPAPAPRVVRKKKAPPQILPDASILTDGGAKSRQVRLAAVEAANDYQDRTRTRAIECCLHAYLLKDLGRAYPAFRGAAKMAFSEQTLGTSPRRRGAERALLSSRLVRPLDHQGKPVVNGVRLSRGGTSEYRGEREGASGRGSPVYGEKTNARMEVLHALNHRDRTRSAGGNRFPDNLHRNSGAYWPAPGAPRASPGSRSSWPSAYGRTGTCC